MAGLLLVALLIGGTAATRAASSPLFGLVALIVACLVAGLTAMAAGAKRPMGAAFAFATVLAVVFGVLTGCAPAQASSLEAMDALLNVPGEYQCLDEEQRPIRVVKNVTPNYALTHHCAADVCGEASWVCRSSGWPVVESEVASVAPASESVEPAQGDQDGKPCVEPEYHERTADESIAAVPQPTASALAEYLLAYWSAPPPPPCERATP